jgi:hypothetical protein
MGVMLSPAWRPFAKQLPEFLLMRRTIAQYKLCQAGRKARFLFGDIQWHHSDQTGEQATVPHSKPPGRRYSRRRLSAGYAESL